MAAYYRPEAARRQAALVPSEAALLFIDVQARPSLRQQLRSQIYW